MAFNDTLFQLGMDLTRSSPAQEEDTARELRSAHEDHDNGAFRDSFVRTTGQHLVIDLVGAKQLLSVKSVERALKAALDFARSDVIQIDVRRAQPNGCVKGIATLVNGQAVIEAWLETGYAAVDFTGCGIRPEIAMTALVDAFGAREVIIRRRRDGNDGARFKKASPVPVAKFQRAVRPVTKTAKARAA